MEAPSLPHAHRHPHKDNRDAIAFNVPVAEFHTADSLQPPPQFSINSAPTSSPPHTTTPKSSAASVRIPISKSLKPFSSQSILAGIGNIFKSELCFACQVNPFRRVATLSITELTCLVGTARKYLQANVTDNSGDQIVTHTGLRRTTGRADREENLWVYKRKGEPCRKCGTLIERRKQTPSARTTFWCPVCQP